MHRQLRWLSLWAMILLACAAGGTSRALAVSVDTVTVSPSVVPVPASAAQKTAVLVSAAVSGLPAGNVTSCTVTLMQLPSNTVIAVSPAVNTSPAPSSGATSVTVQLLLPGSTTPGRAQASVVCGASNGVAPFRITSLVGLVVAPQATPAGGSTSITVLIAGAGVLPATPCTLFITDPSGASPPLATQAVSVSGGTATVPAAATVNLSLPAAAPLAVTNASVSCVLAGSGTVGDSADFTVTDPSVVTLLSVPTSIAAGGTLAFPAITLPGFVCVALLSPAAGGRIRSTAATSGTSGSASLLVALPVSLQIGAASLSVTCSDPGNPANTATSAPLTLNVVAAGTTLGAAPEGCTGLTGGTGAAPQAVAGGPYFGSSGEPVQFSGTGSLPSTSAVLTTCVWNFGDGSRATTFSPVHTYTAAGVYSVSLTVTDSAGLSATAVATVNVALYVPLCSQPDLTGDEGLAPCLTAGVCATASLPGQCLAPCQTYASAALPGGPCPQPGIVVQASAGGPYSGQVAQPLAFQATARAAGTRRVCAADATLGTGGPLCNLVPAVDLPSPVTYLWDFGDGDFGNLANISHSFATPGSYHVTVTVAFDDGSVAVGSAIVQIGGTVSSGP